MSDSMSQDAMLSYQINQLRQGAYDQSYSDTLVQDTYTGRKYGLFPEDYYNNVTVPANAFDTLAKAGANVSTYDYLSNKLIADSIRSAAGAGANDATQLKNYDAPLGTDAYSAAVHLGTGAYKALGYLAEGAQGMQEMIFSPYTFFSDDSITSRLSNAILDPLVYTPAEKLKNYFLDETGTQKLNKRSSAIAEAAANHAKRHYGIREKQGNPVSFLEKIYDDARNVPSTYTLADVAAVTAESAPTVVAALIGSKGANFVGSALRTGFRGLAKYTAKHVDDVAAKIAQDEIKKGILEISKQVQNKSITELDAKLAIEKLTKSKDALTKAHSDRLINVLEKGDDAAADNLAKNIASLSTNNVDDATKVYNGIIHEVKSSRTYLRNFDRKSNIVGTSIVNAGLVAPDAGTGATDEVDRMSNIELYYKSPIFGEKVAQYIADGYSRAEAEAYAREDVLNAAHGAAFRRGIGIGAATGLLSPKVLMGSSAPILANVQNKTFAGNVRGLVTDSLQESGQEFIEEGATQYASNVGVQQAADYTKDLSDNIGTGAVLGAAAGGLTAASIGAPRTLKAAAQNLAYNRFTRDFLDSNANQRKQQELDEAIAGRENTGDVPLLEYKQGNKNFSSYAPNSEDQYSAAQDIISNPSNIKYDVQNADSLESNISAVLNEDDAYSKYKGAFSEEQLNKVNSDETLDAETKRVFTANNAFNLLKKFDFSDSASIKNNASAMYQKYASSDEAKANKFKDFSESAQFQEAYNKASKTAEAYIKNVLSTAIVTKKVSTENGLQEAAKAVREDVISELRNTMGLSTEDITKLFKNNNFLKKVFSSGFTSYVQSNPELQAAYDKYVARVGKNNADTSFALDAEVALYKLGAVDSTVFTDPEQRAKYNELYTLFEEQAAYVQSVLNNTENSTSPKDSVTRDINARDYKDTSTSLMSHVSYLEALMYDMIVKSKGNKSSVSDAIMKHYEAWSRAQHNKLDALNAAMASSKEKDIKVTWRTIRPHNRKDPFVTYVDGVPQPVEAKTFKAKPRVFPNKKALASYIDAVEQDTRRFDAVYNRVRQIVSSTGTPTVDETPTVSPSTPVRSSTPTPTTSTSKFETAIRKVKAAMSSKGGIKLHPQSNKEMLSLTQLQSHSGFGFLNPYSRKYSENGVTLRDIRVAAITPYVQNPAEYANLSYSDAFTKASSELKNNPDALNDMIASREDNIYKALSSVVQQNPENTEALKSLKDYHIVYSGRGNNVFGARNRDNDLPGMNMYGNIVNRLIAEATAGNVAPSQTVNSTPVEEATPTAAPVEKVEATPDTTTEEAVAQQPPVDTTPEVQQKTDTDTNTDSDTTASTATPTQESTVQASIPAPATTTTIDQEAENNTATQQQQQQQQQTSAAPANTTQASSNTTATSAATPSANTTTTPTTTPTTSGSGTTTTTTPTTATATTNTATSSQQSQPQSQTQSVTANNQQTQQPSQSSTQQQQVAQSTTQPVQQQSFSRKKQYKPNSWNNNRRPLKDTDIVPIESDKYLSDADRHALSQRVIVDRNYSNFTPPTVYVIPENSRVTSLTQEEAAKVYFTTEDTVISNVKKQNKKAKVTTYDRISLLCDTAGKHLTNNLSPDIKQNRIESLVYRDNTDEIRQAFKDANATLTDEQLDQKVSKYKRTHINTVGPTTNEASKQSYYNYTHDLYLNSSLSRKYKNVPDTNTLEQVLSSLDSNTNVDPDSGYALDLRSMFNVLGVTDYSDNYVGTSSVFQRVFNEYVANVRKNGKNVIEELMNSTYVSPMYADTSRLALLLGAMAVSERGQATLVLPESTQTKLAIASYLFLTGLNGKLSSYITANMDKAASEEEKRRILLARQYGELDITTVSDLAVEAIEDAFNISGNAGTMGNAIIASFAQFMITSLANATLFDTKGEQFRKNVRTNANRLLEIKAYNRTVRATQNGKGQYEEANYTVKVNKMFDSDFSSSSMMLSSIYKPDITNTDTDEEFPDIILDTPITEDMVSKRYMKTGVDLTYFQLQQVTALSNVVNHFDEEWANYFLESEDIELEVRGLNPTDEYLKNLSTKEASSLRSKKDVVLRRNTHIRNMQRIINEEAAKKGIKPSEVDIRMPVRISSGGRAFTKESMNTTGNPFLRTIITPVKTDIELTEDNRDRMESLFTLGLMQAHDIKLKSFDAQYAEYKKTYADPLLEFYRKHEQEFTKNDSHIRDILKDNKELNKEFYQTMNDIGVNLKASAPVVAAIEQLQLFKEPFANRTRLVTPIYLEVDGMTNGPSNSALYSLASEFDIDALFTSGVFVGTDTDSTEFKNTPGNKDKYELMAEKAKEVLSKLIVSLHSNNGVGAQFGNILKFTFDGQIAFSVQHVDENVDMYVIDSVKRSSVKLVATPISYTAGLQATSKNLLLKMDDGIIKQLGSANNNLDYLRQKLGVTGKEAIFKSLQNKLYGEDAVVDTAISNALTTITLANATPDIVDKLYSNNDSDVQDAVAALKDKVSSSLITFLSYGDFMTMARPSTLAPNLQSDAYKNTSESKLAEVNRNILADRVRKDGKKPAFKPLHESIEELLKSTHPDNHNAIKSLRALKKNLFELEKIQLDSESSKNIYAEDAVKLLERIATGKNENLVKEINLVNKLLFQDEGLFRKSTNEEYVDQLDKFSLFGGSTAKESTARKLIREYYSDIFYTALAVPFYDSITSVFGRDASVYMNYSIASSEAVYSTLFGLSPMLEEDLAFRLAGRDMGVSVQTINDALKQRRANITAGSAKKDIVIPFTGVNGQQYNMTITSNDKVKVNKVGKDGKVEFIAPATDYRSRARKELLNGNFLDVNAQNDLFDLKNPYDVAMRNLYTAVQPYIPLVFTVNGKSLPFHNQLVYSDKRSIAASLEHKVSKDLPDTQSITPFKENSVQSYVTEVLPNGEEEIRLHNNALPVFNSEASRIFPGSNGSGNAVNNNIAAGDALQIGRVAVDLYRNGRIEDFGLINAFDGIIASLPNSEELSHLMNRNNMQSWEQAHTYEDRVVKLNQLINALLGARDIISEYRYNNDSKAITFPIQRDKRLIFNSANEYVKRLTNIDAYISGAPGVTTSSLDEHILYLSGLVNYIIPTMIAHRASIEAIVETGGVVEQYTALTAVAKDDADYQKRIRTPISNATPMFQGQLDAAQKQQVVDHLNEKKKEILEKMISDIKSKYDQRTPIFIPHDHSLEGIVVGTIAINNKIKQANIVDAAFISGNIKKDFFNSVLDYYTQTYINSVPTQQLDAFNRRIEQGKKIVQSIPFRTPQVVMTDLSDIESTIKQDPKYAAISIQHHATNALPAEDGTTKTAKLYGGGNSDPLASAIIQDANALNEANIVNSTSLNDFLDGKSSSSPLKGKNKFLRSFFRYVQKGFSKVWGYTVGKRLGVDTSKVEGILNGISRDLNANIHFISAKNTKGVFTLKDGTQLKPSEIDGAFIVSSYQESIDGSMPTEVHDIYVNLDRIASSYSSDVGALHQVVAHEIAHALTTYKISQYYNGSLNPNDEAVQFIKNIESFYRTFTQTNEETWNSLDNDSKFNFINEFVAKVMQGNMDYVSLNASRTAVDTALFQQVFGTAFTPVYDLVKDLIKTDGKTGQYNQLVLNTIALAATVAKQRNSNNLTAPMYRKPETIASSNFSGNTTVSYGYSQGERTESSQILQDNADSFAARAATAGFNIPQERFGEFTNNLAAFSTEVDKISPYTASLLSSQFEHVLSKDILTPAQRDFLLHKKNQVINGVRVNPENLFAALASVDSDLQSKLSDTPLFRSKKLAGHSVDAILTNLANGIIDNLSLRHKQKNMTIADLYMDSLEKVENNTEDVKSPYVTESVSEKINSLLSAGLEKTTNAVLSASNKVIPKYNIKGLTNLTGDVALNVTNMLKIPQFMRDLVKDLVGRTEETSNMYSLLKRSKSAVQAIREAYHVALPVKLKRMFEGVLSEEDWSTLTHSIGTLGIANVDLDTVVNSFEDETFLKNRLSELESRIPNNKWTTTQIDNLVKYINTGVYTSGMVRNATAIAYRLGSNNPIDLENADLSRYNELADAIDEYITLKAISEQSEEQKEVVQRLLSNNKDNFTKLLSFVKEIEKKDLDQMPGTVAELNRWKGYLPSLPVNSKDITIMPASEKAIANAKKLGWVFVDYYDGPGKYGWYTRSFKDTATFNQGAIQIVYPSFGGINVSSGITQNSKGGVYHYPSLKKQGKTLESIIKDYSEPVVPVFNKDGSILYLERAINPDALGEVKFNTNLADILGTKIGRVVEQEIALEFNKKVVDSLYDMYKNNKYGSKYTFTNIKTSTDPVIKDAYSLISKPIKAYIEQKFGNEGFFVRTDLVNDVIGERTASIGDFWTGKSRWSPTTQRAMRSIFTTFLGNNAYKKLVISEQFAQNLASNLRTTVVVKSFVVPAFNILANILQLHMRGVSIVRIAKEAPTKIAEIEAYIKYRNKIVDLELTKLTSVSPKEETVLNARIAALQRAQDRLSIAPLMKAGEFSTIADVGLTTEDLELTKGRIGDYIESKINSLSDGAIKTLLKYGYLSKDTALYQGLLKSVQYGDFVSKSIYFDYLTQIKHMSEKEALNIVADEFVDYDRQTGRTRGYFESINAFAFGNYKLRSAKAALSLVKHNPFQSLLFAALPVPMIDQVGSPLTESFVPSLLQGTLFNNAGIIDNNWKMLFAHPVLNMMF